MGFGRSPFTSSCNYVLGERQQSGSAPSIQTIIPQIGLMQLITHRYPQSLKLQGDMQKREFVMLAHLAKIVPVRHLHREDNLAGLGKVCDVILEDVAGLKGIF